MNEIAYRMHHRPECTFAGSVLIPSICAACTIASLRESLALTVSEIEYQRDMGEFTPNLSSVLKQANELLNAATRQTQGGESK